MEIVFGTTNGAKIAYMRKTLAPIGIEVASLTDAGAPDLDIDENGGTPLENARIKAAAYYKALKRPVFSCDSGLYIDGLDEARQPGLNIRGAGSRPMDDSETTAFYAALAAEFGGRVVARYRNAICFIYDDARIFEYQGGDLTSEVFYITDKPHAKRVAGFPIDRLSVHIKSGLYYYDMDGYNEKYPDTESGYAAFFFKALAEITR